MNKAKYKQRAESMKRNCSGLEKLTKDSLKTTEKVELEGKAAHQFKQTKFIFKALQSKSAQLNPVVHYLNFSAFMSTVNTP